MSFPGVVFDLDGTLADTLQDLADATNWGLAELGQPTHPVDAYRFMVGTGRTELCRMALPDDRGDLIDRLTTLLTEYYADHCFDHTRLYPGIGRLLDRLRDHGAKLAVLSNKLQSFVNLTIERLMPNIPFDAVIGDDEHIVRKPDPTGALSIAKTFQLEPREIAYVGDTSTDMETAKRAGMFAIGVSWGFRDRSELTQAGARLIVDDPDQLYGVIADGVAPKT